MPKITSISLVEIFPVSQEQRNSRSELEEALELIDQACLAKPDLLCLTEEFAQYGIPLEERLNITETLDGRIVSKIAEKAKKYRCYIICPVLLRESGHLTNSAVLLDRDGQYVGKYDKFMPALAELDYGVKPGKTLPVFETDFGKLGVLICFDLNFPEMGRRLCEQGVKLVCFASMFDGGFLLRQLAFQYQCYILSAVANGTGKIINPLGQVLAESTIHNPTVIAEISLDFELCHMVDNKDKIKAMRAKYLDGLSVTEATFESRYLVSSNRADIRAKDVLCKFQIEPLDSYYARCRRILRGYSPNSGRP